MSNKKINIQETVDYQNKRIKIIKEINADTIVIDRLLFKQNDKEGLKLAKKTLIDNSLSMNDLAKIILNSDFDAGYVKLGKIK